MTDKIKAGAKTPPKLKKKKSPRNSKKKAAAANPEKKAASKEQKHKPTRVIEVNPAILPQLPDTNKLYTTNRISTTKYNAFNFIPKSLLVQFKRVSNIYFLIITIFCSIKEISPLPIYTSVLPLAFVLIMSMARDGYEDIKRRSSDNITNNQKVRILRKPPGIEHNQESCNSNDKNNPYKNLFSIKLWSEVKCGDLILIQEGEHFSADCILLVSSADNGDCFVQTSSLDGERALKHKQCLNPISSTLKHMDLHDFKCLLHAEQPGKNLYEFNGYMESAQFPEQGTMKIAADSNVRTITLDNKQLLLRGSNLANTEWAIGIAVYTGKNTKLMMNQGQARFKQSKTEKLVNVICIYLIGVQAILCLIMAIYAGYFNSKYATTQDLGHLRAQYLFQTFDGIITNSDGTQTDVGSSNKVYSPGVSGLLTYFYYFILLNTLIPISLVVSLEFVKLIQTPFMQHDLEMYDEATFKQLKCMSMTLHEELANIKYVFADKTGTLTSNIMQFKACSIGSVCYDEDYKEDDYEYQIDTQQSKLEIDDSVSCMSPLQGAPEEVKVNDVTANDDDGEDIQGEKNVEQFVKYKKKNQPIYNQTGSPSKINRRNSLTEIIWDYSEQIKIVRELLRTKKFFMNEEINLGASIRGMDPLILKKQTEYLHMFWLNVALCHDVIATKHPQTGLLAYQGSSPDEITLLDAAKEVGYMFVDRTSDTITLEIFGKRQIFRLLQKIEFTSDRKKMTVIIQDPETQNIIVFCKGADLAILDRLSDKMEQHFLDATKEDLVKFSTKGFRTLCFSVKVLDIDAHNDWLNRYENAKLDQIKQGLGKPLAAEQKKDQSQIEKLEEELESDFFLLGATALEDKLQEGVPEVIDDFHQAGIKVWMLTGDKLETAENIGFSSRMFNEKMYIFKLQTKDKPSTRARLLQIENKITEIVTQHSAPIVGTQFVLNQDNSHDMKRNEMQQKNIAINMESEARNMITALEGFRHESKASLYSLNESWARRPVLRRKARKRLEEVVPDRQAIVNRLVREHQFFTSKYDDTRRFVPSGFNSQQQTIVRKGNIYRPSKSLNKKQGGVEAIIEEGDTFGIIVEGSTLHQIMDSDSLTKKFLTILAKCKAVVVCRASPSQKALVVQMVKTNEPDTVTLAIGDGANDVNMIQRAHVGIGIFGKEGYQAAGSSDYAMGQFRFLRRLLFVHGRWNGIRLSNFTLLFFHKNICFTLPQFWFGWQNGFSGQTYWDSGYLSMFNTLATTIAICTYAVWDQDININEEKNKRLIDLFFPYLYRNTQDHELFNRRKFIAWFFISAIQSLAIFGMPIIAYQYHSFGQGLDEDIWLISICSYVVLVNLHYFLLFTFTRNWTIWMVFMYAISYALFCPMFVFVYNRIVVSDIQYRLYEMAFNNKFFWQVTILETIILLFPLMFYFKVQSLLFPTLKDLIIQGRLNIEKVLKQTDPKRLKAAHDLFKQKQQQQLIQWQIEYNNGKPVVLESIKRAEEQSRGLTASGYHKSSTYNAINSLPRKGFSYVNHFKDLNMPANPPNGIELEFDQDIQGIGPNDLRLNETYDSANLHEKSAQLSLTSINEKIQSYANILNREGSGNKSDPTNTDNKNFASTDSNLFSPSKNVFQSNSNNKHTPGQDLNREPQNESDES